MSWAHEHQWLHQSQSSVMIHLNPDGTGSIIEGSPDIGGSRASMQMMAAEVLGVAPATLNPIVADTEHVAYNQTTGGSRTTFATGMAVIEAAEDIIEQLKARAAELWNVTPEQAYQFLVAQRPTVEWDLEDQDQYRDCLASRGCLALKMSASMPYKDNYFVSCR